jgi:hypothetical protein
MTVSTNRVVRAALAEVGVATIESCDRVLVDPDEAFRHSPMLFYRAYQLAKEATGGDPFTFDEWRAVVIERNDDSTLFLKWMATA